MGKIHVHIHAKDDSEAKAKIQALIGEADTLARKMSGPATAGGYQNKYLREAQTLMSGVISELKEAKSFA